MLFVEGKTIKSLGLQPIENCQLAFGKADLVMILNNHPQFATLPLELYSQRMAKPGLIYDFWNHFHSNKVNLAEGVQYIGLGNHKFINKGNFL